MRYKIIVILTMLLIALPVIPVTAFVDEDIPLLPPEYYRPETGIKYDKPQNVFITYIENNNPHSPRGSYFELECTISDDVKKIYNVTCEIQYDYKLDGGGWQSGSSLDSNIDKNIADDTLGNGVNTINFRLYGKDLKDVFPEDRMPEESFFDSHTIRFRIRQIVTKNVIVMFEGVEKYYYPELNFSKWAEVSYNNQLRILDPVSLIDHAPVIKTAELRKSDDGKSYFDCTAEPVHEDINELISVTKSQLKVNMWVKMGGGEWVSKRGIEGFSEKFRVDASDFFGSDEIDKVEFEVKLRYEFEQSNYPPRGKEGVIFGPFSNIISKANEPELFETPQIIKPLWSNASEWALDELKKACEMELIPEVLNGSDFTKPITRAEFAAICVKAYEKLGNTTLEAADVNPFNDTQDSEVLKAYRAGFVAGISDDVFEPESLLNREQAAAMLTRVVKKVSFPKWTLATDVNYALEYTMSEKFSDDENISDWAKQSVYFMVSKGIISGFGNNIFGAKNITAAHEQEGYANTTREQAVLMAYRMSGKII